MDLLIVPGSAVNLNGPVLRVLLDNKVRELPPDQALRVKDHVLGVHRNLVLRSVADHPLVLREREGHRRLPPAVRGAVNARWHFAWMRVFAVMLSSSFEWFQQIIFKPSF